MAGRTAWVLGNQLSRENPVLEGADRILLVESRANLAGKRYHRQKLHLVLSGMRHLAAELREQGREVDVRQAATLREGLEAHVAEHDPEEVTLLEPSSAGGHEKLGALDRVRIERGTLFLTHPDEFRAFVGGRRRLMMEDFYRWQRGRLGILMDGDEPVGGRWNFDADNRRPPPRDRRPPAPYLPDEDEIDAEVRRDLDALGLETFGHDAPRRWPVTPDEARASLARFVEERLPTFGRWQDAMMNGERWMWHGHVGAALNLGLLGPLEAVEAVEAAHRDGRVPIASAEGFVRQVIGWREWVWGLYWLYQDREVERNALGADRPLPAAFWGGPTDMRCLADIVAGVEATAYAHHIERLMVLGNLMLLLGVDPDEAVDWFHLAFIDGYEWVMEPNVRGMATFADGGLMTTKPYAASGRYIQRMSDHCSGCRYTPTKRVGEDACPFTTLYWHFLDRHRDRLQGNYRLKRLYATFDRFDPEQVDEIRARGDELRADFGA